MEGSTATQPAAGWYTDFAGRFPGRYWDGEHWTVLVSDEHGNTSEDLVDGAVRPDRQQLKAIRQAAKAAKREVNQDAQERKRFLSTPVGQAQLSFGRGDQVFQYSHDLLDQQPVIISVMGGKTRDTTSDPSRILNAVCNEGWELVNGSFVFVEHGSQSRNKLMTSGERVDVKGTTVGYYLFRRCPENRNSSAS
jgi:Protein of unknown function (DUF2510)